MEQTRTTRSKKFAATPPRDRYISVQNAVEVLGCMDHQVYSLIQEGKLQAVRIGVRAIRVSEKSLWDFIAANTVDPRDYIAPKEVLQEPPRSKKMVSEEPRSQKIARSLWMQQRPEAYHRKDQ